jgi:hypothetical protein
MICCKQEQQQKPTTNQTDRQTTTKKTTTKARHSQAHFWPKARPEALFFFIFLFFASSILFSYVGSVEAAEETEREEKI